MTLPCDAERLLRWARWAALLVRPKQRCAQRYEITSAAPMRPHLRSSSNLSGTSALPVATAELRLLRWALCGALQVRPRYRCAQRYEITTRRARSAARPALLKMADASAPLALG